MNDEEKEAQKNKNIRYLKDIVHDTMVLIIVVELPVFLLVIGYVIINLIKSLF